MESNNELIYFCSNCDFQIYENDIPNLKLKRDANGYYCPNCGHYYEEYDEPL